MKIYPKFYMDSYIFGNDDTWDNVIRKTHFSTQVRIHRGGTYYLVHFKKYFTLGMEKTEIIPKDLLKTDKEFLEACLAEVEKIQKYYEVGQDGQLLGSVLVDPNQLPDTFDQAMLKQGFTVEKKYSKLLLLISE